MVFLDANGLKSKFLGLTFSTFFYPFPLNVSIKLALCFNKFFK